MICNLVGYNHKLPKSQEKVSSRQLLLLIVKISFWYFQGTEIFKQNVV